MSQPGLSPASPPPASTGPSNRGTIFTSLLCLALSAVLLASLFMLLENRRWYQETGSQLSQTTLILYIAAALLGIGSIIAVIATSRWGSRA